MPGVSPSESPDLCYGMWSRCDYPVLFDDVSPSDVKEAFRLWFRELDQSLPDRLCAAPVLTESDGSPSGGDASTEDSGGNETSYSNIESDGEESPSSDSLDATEAPSGQTLLDPSLAFYSPLRAPFDVQSTWECDSNSDSNWYLYQSHSGDGETLSQRDLDFLSQASFAPPSPSSTSISGLSSTFNLLDYLDFESGGDDALDGASRDQEDGGYDPAGGVHYAESIAAGFLDFSFHGDDDLLFEEYLCLSPSAGNDEPLNAYTTTTLCSSEASGSTSAASSRELADGGHPPTQLRGETAILLGREPTGMPGMLLQHPPL